MKSTPTWAVSAAVAALTLAGCSSGPGGAITCSQFAQMAPDTGLGTGLSALQTAAIKTMLDQHNKASDTSNVMLAQLQITAYCNIFGGHAGSNQNQPIENIGGLR